MRTVISLVVRMVIIVKLIIRAEGKQLNGSPTKIITTVSAIGIPNS